jgi:hypothetical protein
MVDKNLLFGTKPIDKPSQQATFLFWEAGQRSDRKPSSQPIARAEPRAHHRRPGQAPRGCDFFRSDSLDGTVLACLKTDPRVTAAIL